MKLTKQPMQPLWEMNQLALSWYSSHLFVFSAVEIELFLCGLLQEHSFGTQPPFSARKNLWLATVSVSNGTNGQPGGISERPTQNMPSDTVLLYINSTAVLFSEQYVTVSS